MNDVCVIQTIIIAGKLHAQHGYIAQWLEQLTADQQVPGSNPGVPSFAGVTGTGGELARAGVAPSRLSHRVWMTPLCLRGLMDKVPSSLIFEARLRRESRIRGRCGFKSCRGYFLTMFHGRCAAGCGLTFEVRRAGRGGPTPSTTAAEQQQQQQQQEVDIVNVHNSEGGPHPFCPNCAHPQ